MTDLISRADAIEAVKETKPIVRSTERNWGKMIAEQHSKELVKALKALPSAEAEPTVIRSKTLLPTKDFKEWAKRIREENPNAIVIPCDAEVVSAVPQLKQTDTLIIADALRYLIQDTERHEIDRARAEELRTQILQYGASMCSSADAVQGWIPCSERLPSESGDYLCTIPLDADETYTEVLMFHKGRFYEDDDEWGATYHDDVLAWMPLPKPYKGGDSK